MLILALAAALSLALMPPISNSNLSLQSSDLHFSAEDDGVKNTVPIPDGIWSLLKEDVDVQDVMRNQNPPLKEPQRSWFSATVVHLH
jgi:hypothetical protein